MIYEGSQQPSDVTVQYQLIRGHSKRKHCQAKLSKIEWLAEH